MPSSGAVGLYQFNLVAPSIPDDDAVPLSFTLGGAQGTQTLFNRGERLRPHGDQNRGIDQR